MERCEPRAANCNRLSQSPYRQLPCAGRTTAAVAAVPGTLLKLLSIILRLLELIQQVYSLNMALSSLQSTIQLLSTFASHCAAAGEKAMAYAATLPFIIGLDQFTGF